MTDAINIHHLNKWYGKYHALKNIDLNVKKGERLVICGPSGSGKSTLIRCINRLENYQEGEIRLDGELLNGSVRQTRDLRRKVGMVFQQFNLFPHLTILENLTLGPVWVNKQPRAQAEAVARQYLERVGIRDQADKYPGQLSGGQQQRVAIAAALANDPRVLLADEPTGELDQENSAQVLEAMRRAAENLGTTVLIVTHDRGVSSHVRRTVAIRDGRTSTEVIRRRITGPDGRESTLTEEYTVIDRAGRIQIPQEHVIRLGLKDRVRILGEEDHITVRRGEDR